MSRERADLFENILQHAYEWLNEISHLLNWEDRQRAYLALKGVLQALRDRLPIELAVNFAAQLPVLIRGVYYEGWQPSLVPIKIKYIEEFFEYAGACFAYSSLNQEQDIETIVKAVFKVIANRVSAGEILHVKHALPASLAQLWPT